MTKLSAFDNSIAKKMYYYDLIDDWKNTKNRDTSDCFLEYYEDFEKNLGLPLWLAYLLRTINHFNKKDDLLPHVSTYDYRDKFYEKFILSCKLGIDYSKMLHEWQILVLTEFLFVDEIKPKLVDRTIEMHQKALSQTIAFFEWKKLSELIEIELDTYTSLKNKKHQLLRAAYLSIDEVIDIKNISTSSIEALIPYDENNKEINLFWSLVMDDILDMLSQWEPLKV
ncbi:hypothetical protein H4K35_15270 [Myroides sp. NP-2]|uniref:hypothetical protein n=1 Tax=Myroides sp. NP-2 TaxID=2759945 RepID=UPI0015F970DF|nr:hypothetical protein [Myroides sp. NP-2]MBB1151446.1 hypothetical protein [Myroides sp. NP-2]